MTDFDWNNCFHIASGIVVMFALIKIYGKKMFIVWILALGIVVAWALNMGWEIVADKLHLLPAFIPVAKDWDMLDPVRAGVGAFCTWLVRYL